MAKCCTGENCEWKQLAEEVMEDNRQLLEDQRQHIAYLTAKVADGSLRHGDAGPALALLAEADPHDYLDLEGDE